MLDRWLRFAKLAHHPVKEIMTGITAKLSAPILRKKSRKKHSCVDRPTLPESAIAMGRDLTSDFKSESLTFSDACEVRLPPLFPAADGLFAGD